SVLATVFVTVFLIFYYISDIKRSAFCVCNTLISDDSFWCQLNNFNRLGIIPRNLVFQIGWFNVYTRTLPRTADYRAAIIFLVIIKKVKFSNILSILWHFNPNIRNKYKIGISQPVFSHHFLIRSVEFFFYPFFVTTCISVFFVSFIGFFAFGADNRFHPFGKCAVKTVSHYFFFRSVLLFFYLFVLTTSISFFFFNFFGFFAFGADNRFHPFSKCSVKTVSQSSFIGRITIGRTQFIHPFHDDSSGFFPLFDFWCNVRPPQRAFPLIFCSFKALFDRFVIRINFLFFYRPLKSLGYCSFKTVSSSLFISIFRLVVFFCFSFYA